jgi:hypothetical protein
MGEIAKFLKETPFNTLLLIGGFILILVSVTGGIKDWFKIGKTGHIAAGVMGGAMLVCSIGLLLHSPTSSQTSDTPSTIAASPVIPIPSSATGSSPASSPSPQPLPSSSPSTPQNLSSPPPELLPTTVPQITPSSSLPGSNSPKPQAEASSNSSGFFSAQNACSVLSAIPSVKVHVFDGDKATAIRKATDANIPVVMNPELKRNIFGTGEGIPVIKAKLLSSGNSSQGRIQISGTYEIHANDLQGEIPQISLRTVNDGVVLEEKNVVFSNVALMTPISFKEEIPYQVGKVDQVEIHVMESGAFGFFFDKVSIQACQ